jgi:hypothetical protein
MKSKLEIYALSVCFAAVVCLVISAGISVHSLLKIVAPEITMRTYTYNKHLTNEAYWKDSDISCSDEDAAKPKQKAKPKEEEITKQRLESFALEVRTERRDGIQSLLESIIFVLISSITLFIHFKIAQKARGG